MPIPFDPPHEVTIQKLAGRHLQKAREESQFAALEFVKRLGGREAWQQQLARAGPADDVNAQIAEARADPYRRYDRATVLQKGVKSWTYEEPVTAEALDDLTEDVAAWLAREILQLTLPESDEKKSI
ncbi:MAG TPA: hypothetical protein VJM11_03665 [Nevskiaceae bacterium]|nr:hypothetical protein [Nevskiaceae bacterium]